MPCLGWDLLSGRQCACHHQDEWNASSVLGTDGVHEGLYSCDVIFKWRRFVAGSPLIKSRPDHRIRNGVDLDNDVSSSRLVAR